MEHSITHTTLVLQVRCRQNINFSVFTIGVFLCIAIVYTNLAVMKALCMKDSPHNKHNVLMRRISRGSSLTCNAATREERAFGWLMFLLCVAFVTCWVPQMVNSKVYYHIFKCSYTYN